MIPVLRRTRTAPVPFDEPTPRFDGVDLLEMMSAGRRTSTWDAFDTRRSTRCIVKTIRYHRRAEPDIIDAVVREGTVLAELNHPHLVRGYGMLASSSHPDLTAFAMETLPGATLDVLIDRGRFGVDDIVRLGVQLAAGLAYLHRHDWLHLDVKPANVVVHGGRAALLDFGLLSRPGERRHGAGTRGYLAPEQADGRPLTTSADTFALGVTLLEALSGQMPFGDEATWESRRRIPLWHRRMPRFPRGLATDLPADLQTLLAHMVALDPARRPTMAQVWRRFRTLEH